MTKRVQWIVIIGVAVLFFVIGYVFSFLRNDVLQGVGGNSSYQAGWQAAKQRLSDSGAYPTAGANMEVRSLTGEIKEINGDKITLKIRPLEPLADASLDERIITVDQTTKIYTQQPKDSKDFAAEMEAYNKKIKAQSKATSSMPTEPIIPPMGFTKTDLALSDLKAGQSINVTAEKNIKNVKEFSAIEVTFYAPLTSMAAPITPPTIAAPVVK